MRLAALTLLSTLALATPASAAGWHSYSLYDSKAPVAGGTGTHTVRLTSMVLPDSFKVVRHGTTSLTFGPVGACRSTGSVRISLLASQAGDASSVLETIKPTGTSYGAGTRSSGSAFDVVKLKGGSLRAISVSPTRLAGVFAIVRASTTPHATCHIGGVRESLGYPLADAFATIRANGF